LGFLHFFEGDFDLAFLTFFEGDLAFLAFFEGDFALRAAFFLAPPTRADVGINSNPWSKKEGVSEA